jgi:hypothetical protein
VDGTRDRPPGKTAENWSRRDGIRAGSVSGPWRSAPRESLSQPQTSGTPKPQAHEVRDPARAYRVAQAAPERRGLAGMAAWIAFGLLVAVGAVLAAFLLRPEDPGIEPPAESAAPAENAAPAMPPAVPAEPQAPPVTAEAAPVAPGPADPALAAVSDVRLRIGPEFPDAERQTILEALEAAGITGVKVEALPFRIATSRVGYYRAADLPAAEAMVRLVSPVLAEEIGVRDYSQLLSDAAPGRLDLWVGN